MSGKHYQVDPSGAIFSITRDLSSITWYLNNLIALGICSMTSNPVVTNLMKDCDYDYTNYSLYFPSIPHCFDAARWWSMLFELT